MNKLTLTLIATAVTAIGAIASNTAMAQSVAESNGILADATGRTLYTFDKDASNKSNCYGGCAAAWPPFLVKDGEAAKSGYSVVTRDDGSKQWAKGGQPLYYFAADTNAGEVKGDGQGSVWHVIRGTDKRAQSQPVKAGYSNSGY